MFAASCYFQLSLLYCISSLRACYALHSGEDAIVCCLVLRHGMCMLARDQHRLRLVSLPPSAVKPARTLALLRRPLVVRPPSWPFFSASLLCQACAPPALLSHVSLERHS